MQEKVRWEGSHAFLDQRLEACLDPISAQIKSSFYLSLEGDSFLMLLIQVWVPLFSHPVQTIVKSRLYPRLLRAKKPKSLCPCLLSRLKYTQRSFCRLPEGVASTPPEIPLDAQRYPPKGQLLTGTEARQQGTKGQRRDHPVTQSGKCPSLKWYKHYLCTWNVHTDNSLS